MHQLVKTTTIAGIPLRLQLLPERQLPSAVKLILEGRAC